MQVERKGSNVSSCPDHLIGLTEGDFEIARNSPWLMTDSKNEREMGFSST